jgi:hypothetical protein
MARSRTVRQPALHQAPEQQPDAAPDARQQPAPQGPMTPAAAFELGGSMGNHFVQSLTVQRREDRGSEQDHAAAKDGVGGGGGPLPYLAEIQAAFGGHDVSGARAHIGGGAARSCEALGALAYATGEDVAFAGTPDLHTAAHEAAHVVQQRAGVSLKGGFGQTGDAYERHADAVADRVVSGESAEDLLDQRAGGGASAAAVQGNYGPYSMGQRGSPQPTSSAPLDITVVDDSDWIMAAAAALRGGEISGVTDVRDMVDKVLQRADARKIHSLTLIGHGAGGYQKMGSERSGDAALSLRSLPALSGELGRLTGKFTSDATVELHGCRVASTPDGVELLRQLSQLWGVPVTAGVPLQRPLLPGYEGTTVTCEPGEEGGTTCDTDPGSLDEWWDYLPGED